MRPCEEVIVTVNITNAAVSYDMELPAFIPVGDLKVKLMETLRLMDTRRFALINDLELSYNGQPLRNDLSLAGHGVWDGSIVEVSFKNDR